VIYRGYLSLAFQRFHPVQSRAIGHDATVLTVSLDSAYRRYITSTRCSSLRLFDDLWPIHIEGVYKHLHELSALPL